MARPVFYGVFIHRSFRQACHAVSDTALAMEMEGTAGEFVPSISFFFLTMRNIFCPYYSKCLDQAARQNSPGFDCSKCFHCKDKTDFGEIEMERYYLLLWGIFKPNLYRKYRALESARAQKKRSKPERPDDDMQL